MTLRWTLHIINQRLWRLDVTGSTVVQFSSSDVNEALCTTGQKRPVDRAMGLMLMTKMVLDRDPLSIQHMQTAAC